MKRILITGASGGVAGKIRPLLRPDYSLRLSDRRPIADAEPGEEVILAELGDMAALRAAVSGMDGIIHLGGYSTEADFATILEANIVGTHNLFEAARLEGVKRIVFASSNHAVGLYRKDARISVDVTVRPDSRYGVSKAFGEALASLYAYKYGAEILSIRIGNVDHRPVDLRRLSIWISPRDLVQLIRIGLEHPGIRHEIVYGMSDNARGWWDNGNAFRLGYRPVDKSEDYAAAILAADPGPTGNPQVDDHQGAGWCIAERT